MSETIDLTTEFPSEMDEDEEKIEYPVLGPELLGLYRVGTILPPPQKTLPILDLREMPEQIRKLNKIFIDIPSTSSSSRRGRKRKKKPAKRGPKAGKSAATKKIGKGIKKQPTVKKSTNITASTATTSYSTRSRSDSAIFFKPFPVTTTLKASMITAAKTNSGSTPKIKQPIKKNRKENTKNIPYDNDVHIPRLSPITIPTIIDEEKTAQITARLRNSLKQELAYKWMIYEFFYSLIDKPLFAGENEFQSLLKQTFPKLRTRNLTRMEWRKVRSLMGKPRRCSAAFFLEERRCLELKRYKIRLLQTILQTDNVIDINFVSDLPNDIPLPLPVGAKVTARLRNPKNGLYTGVINSYDPNMSGYTVCFDRKELGIQLIPDYELRANDYHETTSIFTITYDFTPTEVILQTVRNSPIEEHGVFPKSNFVLAGGGGVKLDSFQNSIISEEKIGDYPVRLLELMIRVKKLLAMKHITLQRLSYLNRRAAMNLIPQDFPRRYTKILMFLEKINTELIEFIRQIQFYANDLKKDAPNDDPTSPKYIRRKCWEVSSELVEKIRCEMSCSERIAPPVNIKRKIVNRGCYDDDDDDDDDNNNDDDDDEDNAEDEAEKAEKAHNLIINLTMILVMKKNVSFDWSKLQMPELLQEHFDMINSDLNEDNAVFFQKILQNPLRKIMFHRKKKKNNNRATIYQQYYQQKY